MSNLLEAARSACEKLDLANITGTDVTLKATEVAVITSLIRERLQVMAGKTDAGVAIMHLDILATYLEIHEDEAIAVGLLKSIRADLVKKL